MVYRSDNLQEILDHVREQFNFKVDLVPLFGIAGIDPMTPRPTSWYGCFRDDTNEPLGASVSGSYTPHQTDDVIALVDAAIGAFGRGVTEVKTDFADGHNVLVSPSAEWQKTVAGKDVVYPRLLVSAGYGGTSRLRCSLGLYRCLCENLEMFETISALNFSHKHTSGLLAKIDTIRKSFSGLARSWDSLETTIDRAAARTVSIASTLDRVYGTPAEGASEAVLRNHDERTEAIVNRLFDERNRGGYGLTEAGQATAWELYQAVQGYHLWDATKRGARHSRLQEALRVSAAPAVRTAERILISA